jgi:FAD/FMN-containing dehydrogenase
VEHRFLTEADRWPTMARMVDPIIQVATGPTPIERPTAAPSGAALSRLERSFSGGLFRPGDPAYEEHRRVWNGSIDRRPALIARCASEPDVVAAVIFAREAGLPIAVRGGGHSFPGLSVCDGGVVIDLRPMAQVHVDPASRTVQAQAGALLGELDRATQAHGLAVPVGAVSHTGIAGLTLGGGIGWLMRRHGLTIDNLVAVRLVTADGRVVMVGSEQERDLFWALRGGGGNFGIVTEFTYRAHPVGPTVLGGLMLWPLEQAPEVCRFYREWCAEAPDALTTALAFRRAPELELVPTGLHGRPVVAVVGCWSGDPEAGRRVLAPLRAFRAPAADAWQVRPLIEMQSLLDPSYPHGLWVHMRACDVARLDDGVLDVMVDHAGRIDSPRSTVTVWHLGGAVARVEPDATAFGSREAGHVVNITGATESAEGFEGVRDWVRAHWTALVPYQQGVYVNFLMEEGQSRVRQAYGTARYERLRSVKRRVDPQNVFRLNQNIRPD